MARRDEDRGAVLVMTVFIVVVTVAIAAFAVDLGVQRSAIRDMQAVADAAALDAARRLPACDDAALTSVARESRGRQGGVLGSEEELVAVAGHLTPEGRFVAGSDGMSCTAVRVTSGTTVSRVFAAGNGKASRAAVATRDAPGACLVVGSMLASLDTSSATFLPDWFGKVLGIDGDVLSSGGLADLRGVEVPLADIAAELGAVSPEGLLDTGVTALRLAEIAAQLVHQQGAAGADVAIDALVAALGASGRVKDLGFALGDILALDTTGSAALTGDVNVLDLLGLALEAASAQAGAPAYTVSTDGLVPLTITLIEPAKMACGRPGSGATAHSSQAKVEVNVPLSLLNLRVPGLLDAGLTGSVPLTIELAQATGTLTDVQCDQEMLRVQMSGSGARISGGATLDFRVRVSLLGIPLPIWLDLRPVLSVSAALLMPPEEEILLPFGDGAEPRRYGGDVGAPLVLNAHLEFPRDGLFNQLVGAVAGGLSGLLDIVLPLVTNALKGVLSPVLNTLTNGLGIDVAGARVQAGGTSACDGVRLVEPVAG